MSKKALPLLLQHRKGQQSLSLEALALRRKSPVNPVVLSSLAVVSRSKVVLVFATFVLIVGFVLRPRD